MNREEEIKQVAENYASQMCKNCSAMLYCEDKNKKCVERCEQRDWSKFEPEKPKWIPSTEHPVIDEEVIALIGEYNKITFAHIVDKNKAIDYDGWNIPDVKCWIPCPKIEED